jgi:hypothetical protein
VTSKLQCEYNTTYYSFLTARVSLVHAVWVLPSEIVPAKTLYTLLNAVAAKASSGPEARLFEEDGAAVTPKTSSGRNNQWPMLFDNIVLLLRTARLDIVLEGYVHTI